MSVATGIKIKKIREFKNYTQDYMANKLGMSQNSYSRIESGQTKLDIDRLKEISKLLDVPVETMVSDELHIVHNNNGHHIYYGGYALNIFDKEAGQVIKEMQDEMQRLRDELESIRSRK